MHEFSLCESIVNTLLSEYEKLKKPADGRISVTRVRMAVGKLRAVVPESMLLAWEVLTRETPLHEARLELVAVPVAVRCRACTAESEIDLPLFVCPLCGGTDLDILRGNELMLEEMEVETP
ncbi:MAG TPA: hydrogenase maturation nickel metallochaperone HypA [Spirochaetia bacterium]|nr:hydrogenase maturation nickel metallochaperone HypA [Spirochaetia bacterium]